MAFKDYLIRFHSCSDEKGKLRNQSPWPIESRAGPELGSQNRAAFV